MEKFLEKSKYLNYDSPIISLKAKELFHNNMTDIEKAKAAYRFVRDDIPHSFDCKAEVITAIASDVLNYKSGICHAKANLLATLLRSQGIPTGFCFQHITLAQDDSLGYCLHCFNAIYLDNRWIQVDASGNSNSKNTHFSMDSPSLAYMNRAQYDEYFFPGIYSEPDGPTMEMLEQAESLQDILNRIPEKPSHGPNILV